jgi:predicted amidohydrolase YtcJ
VRHRRLEFLICAIGFLAVAAALPPAPSPVPADLVLRNAAVYTVDGARSWAEAVAVSKGRIVFVGANASASPWIAPSTKVVDLAGKMVLPAFHDSHVHPVSGGVEALECNLNGLATQEAILDKIKRYAAERPNAKWIRGGGWDLTIFPDGNPSKDLLDTVVPDRPAYLSASDGHSVWVNSKALALAGVTKATPDPPYGRVERDPKTGQPSGTLREDAADLVAKLLPKRSSKEYVDGLAEALRIANGFGLTSLVEASASEEDLESYAALDAQGKLTARVLASLYVNTDKGTSEVPRLVALRKKYAKGRVRTNAVKIFADGVLETRTASVLEPYVGFPNDRGKPNLQPAAFQALATALDKEGFQIHVHAIGDRAIRDTFDALEAARRANGARDSRHHIAHIELFDPADIPRFRKLGVIANFQPLWANGDQYITELTEPKLGPERSRWLYPIGSVLASGGEFAFGSDWSVSSMNPFEGMEVAVTRRQPSQGPGPAWIPEERIALPEAIAAYTIRGAYLDFSEKDTGSIEVGKAADLIVLDRNLFEIPPSQIHDAKVLLTLLDGKEVFRASEFSAPANR